MVAHGFIDNYQHGQDHENYSYKVMDSVTNELELAMGTADIESFPSYNRSFSQTFSSERHVSVHFKLCFFDFPAHTASPSSSEKQKTIGSNIKS